MTDALERLKNRNRPTVPNRDASLGTTSNNTDTETSRYLDLSKSITSDIPQPTYQEVVSPLETKQTTLRLEVGISDRLQNLGRDNEICREVLIEAMFEYCESNPEALQTVLGEAKVRNEHRQSIANQKRAKSMMERFGHSS